MDDERPGSDDAGFFAAVVGDGRPLLLATAGALAFAGGLALFLAAARQFLPHDVDHLGMTADDLCRVGSCRIVDFMAHDRAAFGGTLLGLSVIYVWLTAFPLSAGEQWAWWTWLVTGLVGFATFFAYLGYGYLDTWHGLGTLLLAPVYVTGMVRSRRLLAEEPDPWSLVRNPARFDLRSRVTWGRVILLAGAAATAGGGLAILGVGVTDTFVPEDLEFIGLSAAQLEAVNPRLVPLIAHDRAGFGGAVLTLGMATFLCLWCARPSRHLRQAVAAAGIVSVGAVFTVHATVGYTDWWHLLPTLVAAALLVSGLTASLSPERAGHGATAG